MATLAPHSPPSSPLLKSRQRQWARKCERCCWTTLTYSPLLFVYGLTSWAVAVEASLGFSSRKPRWIGAATSLLGIVVYTLLVWSYTVAVFVDPGSPLSSKGGYSHLPTQEPYPIQSLTVKSTGDVRYCKKCQARKPDRAHHCSTCKRCVLKMDHHCPWLATCLGLRNYKAFVLFLIYATLFCWLCFAISSGWLWSEVFSRAQYAQEFMPINYVLLAIVSGVFGLVLTGFTGWHIYLVLHNQTTIERLEKIRYRSPFRRSMQHQGRNQPNGSHRPNYRDQVMELPTTVLLGNELSEDGEERTIRVGERRSAHESLYSNYADMERSRERERYAEYLDEQDSEKLPHAFDLGWRANLGHLFGERPLLWGLPICNTTGDGWHWEPSRKWLEARNEISRERDMQRKMQQQREDEAGWGRSNANGGDDDFEMSAASSQTDPEPQYVAARRNQDPFPGF